MRIAVTLSMVVCCWAMPACGLGSGNQQQAPPPPGSVVLSDQHPAGGQPITIVGRHWPTRNRWNGCDGRVTLVTYTQGPGPYDAIGVRSLPLVSTTDDGTGGSVPLDIEGGFAVEWFVPVVDGGLAWSLEVDEGCKGVEVANTADLVIN